MANSLRSVPKKAAAKKSAPKKSSAAQEFNPAANYAWKADDVLSMTGGDLHILHSTFQGIFDKGISDAHMYVALSKCYEISTGLLKRGVEQGVIVQTEPEQVPN